MTIIVCPLSHVPAVAEARRPSHIISLLDPDHAREMQTPECVAPDRHLKLGVYDVCAPVEGMTPPEEGHVLQILAFGRDWTETSPILVHCWAGISRSTATAFMLACERNPHALELDIAWRLRRAAPHAYPNRRLVRLADDILGRGGRMADAVDAIGGNNFISMGAPFDLPARY